jgi:hypothetical protein
MRSPSRSAPIWTARTQCRQRLLSGNPYEVVKDGSTNPDAAGAVEPYVAVSQVDSKTGEDATGTETETDE